MFEKAARRYERRYFFGMIYRSGLGWLPLGYLLGIGSWYLSVARDLFPLWVMPAASLVPSLAAMLAVPFRMKGTLSALAWLDRETQGRQELQAAWENRNAATALAELVVRRGEALLQKSGPRPPRPHPNPKTSIIAVMLAAVLLAMAVIGGDFFAPRVPPLDQRGRELESWAQTWAEGVDGLGRPESRELADRMGSLGRQMADGALGERQAERALRQLQEEIEERRGDLVRESLAESLVDDLNVDRETAEMFRVRKKRLPASALTELNRAIDGASSLSEMSREALDQLLSDPDLRNRMGDGTPELTEKLTQALKDALDPDDPRLEKLEKAVERTRQARGETPGNDEASGGSSGGSPEEKAAENEGASGSDTEPDRGAASDDSENSGRQGGGSGRGTEAAADGEGSGDSLRRSSSGETLTLPSETDRSGSWRTVIRAYSDEGSNGTTPNEDLAAQWNREVESVIRREDIPPSTRDYVRDYFTALEAGPAESKQEE
ncbi:MAG: hypothetical protein P1P77_04215 [Spirochaetaceae bacterium]|nr:hypothetical protein [Spirochaetaceae bacterium]